VGAHFEQWPIGAALCFSMGSSYQRTVDLHPEYDDGHQHSSEFLIAETAWYSKKGPALSPSSRTTVTVSSQDME
jgi:hypothetical protein